MAEKPVPKVLVTGASGFIASHVITQLLEQGEFAVRGTVRSLQKEEKVKPLRELVPNPKIPLELVEADLLKADSWPAAVEGCRYALHIASPFPLREPRNDAEMQELLIAPAVEGTKNVLKACAEAGVKRVVLTSSIAAVSAGMVGCSSHPVDKPYSEEDWSPPEECQGYERSKTLAEKAAWNFLKELPDEKKFELVVMNPSYVLGPVVSRAAGEGSVAMLQKILSGNLPGVFAINFPLVDVRDVAAAHIKGMTVEEANGHRFILVSGNLWMSEVAEIIQKEFDPQGYKIKTRKLPKFLLWLGSIFDSSAKKILPVVGKQLTYDTTPMKTVLGIESIDQQKMLIDMAYSLIEYGFVEKKPGYQPQGEKGKVESKE